MDAIVEYEYQTQSGIVVLQAIPNCISKLLDELIPQGWELYKVNDVFPVRELEAFYLMIFRRPKPALQFQT